MGIFQLIHSINFIYLASDLLIKKYEGCYVSDSHYKNIMCSSIAYFVYDNFGKPFPSISNLHHFIAVCSLVLINDILVRDTFIYGMLMFEISNIPLFWAYMARHKNIINRYYIRQCDEITMYVYPFFRLVMYLGVYLDPVLRNDTRYIFLSILWYLPGIIWTKKMYSRLKNCHFI